MTTDVNTGRLRSHEPAATILVLLTIVAAGVLAFASGGYILTRSAPVALAYLLVAALWVWFLRDASRPTGVYLIAMAAFGLFVAWTGMSILWSMGPDLSWEAFNVAALYLAVAAIVGFTPIRRTQIAVLSWGYLAVAVAVGIYAFLGKAAPNQVTHAHDFARLSSPVGYWNVLALFMVLALPVALALGGGGVRSPLWRAAAAAAGVPVLFAFFFTFSRGGWLALVVVLLVYFILAPARLSSMVSLAVIVAPAAYVVWRLRGLETLFDTTEDAVLRAAEGQSLLVWSISALCVTAVAQALVALAQGRFSWPRSLRLATGGVVLVTLVVVVLGGSWVYVGDRGGMSWVRDRADSFLNDSDEQSSANNASRLTSLNTYRLPLWREAVKQAEVVPVNGSGAGTFPFTHYRFRIDQGVVRHAHSQWFNVLGELGIVGLALFVPALVLFAVAAIGNPFAISDGHARALLAALQAGIVAFLVHISYDWTWDMASIGIVFFLFTAACASFRATRRADACGQARASGAEDGSPGVGRRTGRPLRLALSLALVLLAASWLFPYLAARAEDAALTASAENDIPAALEHAQRAARLNPLAAEPLIRQAQLLQQLGRNRDALAVLEEAERLQPDNFDVHKQQGELYVKAFNRRKEAKAAFVRALSLNPNDSELQGELQATVDN